MTIIIEKRFLKKKNRKRPWILYCENCGMKLELNNFDIYYQTLGITTDEGTLFTRTCSYECAQKEVKKIAEAMYLIEKNDPIEVMYLIEKNDSIEEFEEWFKSLSILDKTVLS